MVRRRAIGACIVAVAVALASLAPTASATFSAKKAIWGPLTDFPTYHNLGVGIYEMHLDWRAVAPTRPRNATNPSDPAYQWTSDIPYAIGQAARYHMRILLQVSQTPAWENGGHAPNYPPPHPGDMAAFMTAAAHRYPSVHLWMIWGEPDRRPNWATLVSAVGYAHTLTPVQAAAPRLYARILDASYGALKAASARNLVIGGNTYTSGYIPTRLWLKYMRLPNGKPPRLDLYGHNPFTARAPNLHNPRSPDGEFDFSDLGRLEHVVSKYLAPPHHVIKLFLSEWMIPTAPDIELNIYTTPAVQAEWIRSAWHIVVKSRWIYALGWIHVYDGGGSFSGLLYANGKPKPGYYAFKSG